MKRRKVLASAGAAIAAAALPQLSLAQSASKAFDRPIQLIVPFAAGGSTDVTARALAKAAEPLLGQTVVIQNKPGAAGAIALAELKNAPADGLTVAVFTAAAATVSPQIRKVGYSALTDFEPFMNYGMFSSYIAVAADGPYKTIEDLLEDIRRRPGQVVIGTTGHGSIGHLAGARLMEAKGLKAEFAAYAGGSKIVPALLGKHLGVAILGGEVAPHVHSGKIKLLLSMTEAQLKDLPGIPPMKSIGVPWTVESWIALAVRKGTPPARLAALEAAFQSAAKTDEFLATMEKLATIVDIRNGSETVQLLNRTYQENGRLVQALGLAEK